MVDEREDSLLEEETKYAVESDEGIIDYDSEAMKDVVGGEKLSYDEYIEIQKRSAGKVRSSFQLCYIYVPLGFKGQIERKNSRNVCFKRIYVYGMYPDGLCFEGKEDHVWMDLKGFEDYQEGDSVSFWAEVYRYLKTGNGKMIDYGLRNPKQIEKIEPYELPSDEELFRQNMEMIACESCFLSENCSGVYCMLSKPKNKSKKKH